MAGDREASTQAMRQARVALDGIADAEDRRLIESDLDQLVLIADA